MAKNNESLDNENLGEVLGVIADVMIDDFLNKPGGMRDQVAEARARQPDLVYGYPANV